MMETEKLRKADIFTGTAIMLLGLFIISQGVQMPMKDSYAGVQNVWYVSPALLPLFIGAVLTLLGASLLKTALKAVGLEGLYGALNYLRSSNFISFLKQDDTIRFYGIVLNLIVYVFIMIPRIDFFPASILFLLIFFFMFYCSSPQLLLRLIWQALAGTIILCLFMFSGLAAKISSLFPFPADYLTVFMIFYLIYATWRQLKGNAEMMVKFRRSLIIAFAAPLTIGIIFKYFLLVPMPFEGLIVSLLDSVWYADFWS